MDKYKFYKNEVEWFVDLPEYIEKGGDIGDLQMVEGADLMLEIISEGKKEVLLSISNEKFDKSDQLILIEKCHPLKGGGYYFMNEFEHKEVNLRMWLCGVVEFVFGNIPENIFLRREKL